MPLITLSSSDRNPYRHKDILFPMSLERCSICNREADLHKDNKAFCASHYVAVSDEESLYWDLHALLKQDMIGSSSQSPRRLFEAIKKRAPHLIQRYYCNQQKNKPSVPAQVVEPEEELDAESALAIAHERAKGTLKE